MDSLALLTTRRSVRKLTSPGPDAAQLEIMLQAATQVPDHGNLTPYQFTVIAGDEAKRRFRDEVLLAAAGDDEALREKAANLINMAPVLIGVCTRLQLPNSWNIPQWEQEITAGCATYALQLAAEAQGFSSVWISGAWAKKAALREALGGTAQDKVIGLLLLGTAVEALREPKNTELDRWVRYY